MITYHGMPIGWLSKTQDDVPLSTEDAEYRAMVEVIQRAVYAITLARSFSKEQVTIEMETYDMTALDMMNAIGATERSNFVDIRHNYIKHRIRNTNISLNYTLSQRHRADLFTKPLEWRRLELLSSMIDVAEIPNIEKDIMGWPVAGNALEGACGGTMCQTLRMKSCHI